MENETITKIRQDIQEAEEDLKKYENYQYFKKECINNKNIHIKLLKEKLKEELNK
jgi:hypothetical protein